MIPSQLTVYALLAALALPCCGRVGFDSTEVDADAIVADAVDGGAGIRGPRGMGAWRQLPSSPLAGKYFTSGAWTGTEFAVFGGAEEPQRIGSNTGALFNPVTQTWRAMSNNNAPAPRLYQKMVAMDDEVFVVGGFSSAAFVGEGARYNPALNTWQGLGPVNSSTAPGQHAYGVAIAITQANQRLFVWGGLVSGTTVHTRAGAIYNPATDTWTRIATLNAPSARSYASVVWTGSRVIVWGGCDGDITVCGGIKADGAIYNPIADTWTQLSMVNAPQGRYQHVAAWTGSEMIIFGGAAGAGESLPLNDGAIYNPATDSWRPMSSAGAPSPRLDSCVAWMVDRLLIWGGHGGQLDGGLYDPITNTWTTVTAADAPSARARVAWAVSDTQLYVWGGVLSGPNPPIDNGAVWSPDP